MEKTIKQNSPLSQVASRYADSIYQLAKNNGDELAVIEKDMDALASTLANSQPLADFANSPLFSIASKQKLFAEITKQMQTSKLFAKFVQVVIGNKRSAFLAEIIYAFKLKLAELRGEEVAEIIVAKKLTDSQIETLQNTLQQSINKKVAMHISQDSSLLGGMIVKIGSKQVDSSIKTKLARLQLTLTEAV